MYAFTEMDIRANWFYNCRCPLWKSRYTIVTRTLSPLTRETSPMEIYSKWEYCFNPHHPFLAPSHALLRRNHITVNITRITRIIYIVWKTSINLCSVQSSLPIWPLKTVDNFQMHERCIYRPVFPVSSSFSLNLTSHVCLCGNQW